LSQPSAIRPHSPGQIALACFIGTPAAGCFLLANNYRLIGELKKATCALIWVVGLLASSLIAERMLESGSLLSSIGLFGFMIGLYQFAENRQGEWIDEHVAKEGRLGSYWAVFGVSILSIAILAALLGSPD